MRGRFAIKFIVRRSESVKLIVGGTNVGRGGLLAGEDWESRRVGKSIRRLMKRET